MVLSSEPDTGTLLRFSHNYFNKKLELYLAQHLWGVAQIKHFMRNDYVLPIVYDGVHRDSFERPVFIYYPEAELHEDDDDDSSYTSIDLGNIS